MKIKFSVGEYVGEVGGDQQVARTCYQVMIKEGWKRNMIMERSLEEIRHGMDEMKNGRIEKESVEDKYEKIKTQAEEEKRNGSRPGMGDP